MSNNIWFNHKAGDPCPIPWADKKDWEYYVASSDVILKSSYETAKESDLWKNGCEWRLTNGWIPVIDGKMPKEIVHCRAGEWEFRQEDNSIIYKAIAPAIEHYFKYMKSARLIKKPEIDDGLLHDCCHKEPEGVRAAKSTKVRDIIHEDRPYNTEPVRAAKATKVREISVPARSSDAYTRFRSSPRGKEALAMIGKAEGPTFKPLGEDVINEIAAAALEAHDQIWPRRK